MTDASRKPDRKPDPSRKPDRKPDQDLSEAEILERYKPFLHQQALRFAKQGMELEDLIQEGSLALIKSFRLWKPDGGANVLTWIRHPVINAMTKALKNRNKHLEASMDEPIASKGTGLEETITLHDVIGSFIDPEDVLLNDRLRKAIERLPDKEKAIIDLTLDGKTLSQIGEVFGVSRERIRQIRNKAFEEIKDQLQKPPRRLRAV